MKRCEGCGKEVDRVMSVTNKAKKKAEGLCIDCAVAAISAQ